MNCNEVLNLQSLYLDGELEEEKMQEIRAHLKTCDTCRQEFEEMKALLNTLQTLDDIPVPEHLADEVISAVKQSTKKEKHIIVLPHIFRSWQTYSVVAACMLLFTAIYSGTDKRSALTNNTAYMYTTESVAPKAVEIPAPLSEDVVVPANTTAPSPAPAMPSAPAPFRNEPRAASIPAPVAELPQAAVFDISPAVTEAQTPAPITNSASDVSKVLPPRPATGDAARTAPAPQAKEEQNTKQSGASATSATPAAPAYSTVGSLVKRRITFVVDDAAAQSVFNGAKSGGVAAVKNALYSAGIDFHTRESVIEELAPAYNALVNEANNLSARIAAGNTSLRSQLSKKEAEMKALKNAANAPSLSLAFE